MLLVRDETFIVDNDELYIIGSSNNKLYDCNEYAMGPVDILSWDVSYKKPDISKLEKYKEHKGINIILNDGNVSFFKKCKVIKENVKKADIVVAKLAIIDAIVACHYARKYKKTLVVESGSDAYAAFKYHGGLKYRLAARPLNMLTKHYHKKADYIIYVSQKLLQDRYPSKAISIGCADVVLEKTPEEVLDKRLARIKANDGKSCTVGLIGATQAEYRGHDTLITASGILKKRGYDVKIKFLGGGTMNDKRIAHAKACGVEDKIEFCGRLPRDKVFGWVDDIDILAMPTMVESLGRAALEGMSRGCPVIGTYETALAEIIADDLLMHAKDANRLADIIEKLITDKEYASMCAKRSFAKALEFEKDRIMNIRKDFYTKVRQEGKRK